MKKTINFNQDNKKESISLKILKFFSGDFWFNKYVLIFAFIYILSCVGGTYAYLSFSAQNSNTVVGIVGSPDLDLVVQPVIPSTSGNTGVMIPQLESALGTAISNQYNCVDDNDNIVCKVYRATVTNNGNTNIRIRGDVSFTGISSMPNLKWKRIESATSVGEYSSNIASTRDVSFEREKMLEVDESETYYFVIWIDETGETQTDSGTFRMTIKFNSANGSGISSTIVTPFIHEVMAVNASSDKDIDFSVPSSASGTNGIYYVEETKNDTNPIYYYRGAVDNNLLFADTCWKIVRTTETGGLKLIYNGVPSGGTCNNIGSSTRISIKDFNTYGGGYMYNVENGKYDDNLFYLEESDFSNMYVFGNSVNYSNGIYTLVDTVTNLEWNDVYYQGGVNNYHYTCFTTGTTCTSVYYVTSAASDYIWAVLLTDGDNIEKILVSILGVDDNNPDNYNVMSSEIKGNNTTIGTLDYWYYTNIEQKGYGNYIEDTIWCNDRSVYNYMGLNPNGGNIFFEYNDDIKDQMYSGSLYFSDTYFSELFPKLTCDRKIDRFTANDTNGNGDLDYPVGLITASEAVFAGATADFEERRSNESFYLYDSLGFWTMSPGGFGFEQENFTMVVDSEGELYSDYNIANTMNDEQYGVRPSISLKAGFSITGGNGTTDSPYVVG